MEKLSDEQLRAIRALVDDVDRGELRRGSVVTVVDAMQGHELTIDGDASAALGAPLVVVRPQRTLPGFVSAFTPREREVLDLVASGHTNQEIADALFISIATVKDHVHNMLRKSGCSSRSALIADYLS